MSMLGHYCLLFEELGLLKTKGFSIVKYSDSVKTLGWGDAFYVRK